MNFLALAQRLRQEAGASGTGPLTTVNQAGESRRFVDWVAAAYQDIQSQREDWQWMRRTCAFPLVSGQLAYTPAQANAALWGYWAPKTFRNYANPPATLSVGSPGVVSLPSNGLVAGDTVTFDATAGVTFPTGVSPFTPYFVTPLTPSTFTLSATLGGAAINTTGASAGSPRVSSSNTTSFSGLKSEVYMTDLDYDDWRDSYLYGALRFVTTRPLEITVDPAKGLRMGPMEADGYTVLGDYFQKPYLMVNDADIPALPEQMHMMIVWKALLSYGLYVESPGVVQNANTHLLPFERKLNLNQLPTVEFVGALA